MFTRRTSAKAEGKGKTQDHYRQKPPGSCLYCRLRAGFFPGPSWPHPEPPDHYRFLHISSGDTAPHYAFCARAHSLMESSVWHGREQEATNSLQDWSIKATIKVLGGGGVGEETLFQKGPSPTKLQVAIDVTNHVPPPQNISKYLLSNLPLFLYNAQGRALCGRGLVLTILQ